MDGEGCDVKAYEYDEGFQVVHDAFFALSKEDAHERQEEAVGKEQRKAARETHAAAELAVWKRDNEQIRGRNEAKKAAFTTDTAAWDAEKAAAKADKQKRGWDKPKWKDYLAEKVRPQPKKVEEEDSDGDEEPGSDMDLD
ncbi:hypothetical protein C8R46DRAFT_1035808 [Mycena filopes]|nr:hypothetical protein C8R46DRAFT_1035808 [Mycena filopes]